MNTPTRLSSYLTSKGIPYQEVEHFRSNSSIVSAITANVSLNKIAKAVILKNHEDKKVMAILPASHKVSLSVLNESLHGSFRLMDEQEVYQVFSDCNQGAVPPAAEAYHLSMVCERELDQLAEVYLESGNHSTLLCVRQRDFRTLTTSGPHLHFSREVFH